MEIYKNHEPSPNDLKINQLEEKIQSYEKLFIDIFAFSDIVQYSPMEDYYIVFPSRDSHFSFRVYPYDGEIFKFVREEYLRRRENGE